MTTTTGFMLRDDPPAAGSSLRPITWHVSALLASGFQVAVHETKHDRTGQTWRTWKASEWPLVASPDPHLARGAAHCVATLDAGKLAAHWPSSPYLAAWLGARNHDLLAEWRARGGAGYVSRAVSGGLSPLVELVAAGTAPDLAEMVLGTSMRARITHPILAATLVTLGFPLAGLTPSGVAQVLGLRPHAESGPNDAESLLCTGLSFGVAHEAAQYLDEATGAQDRRRAVADGVALENAGPLAPGHLFNWAWMGAVRRAGLQRLEAAMGHDGASLRSHVLQARKVRVDDGLAVVCTAEEFSANEDFILAHLRGR